MIIAHMCRVDPVPWEQAGYKLCPVEFDRRVRKYNTQTTSQLVRNDIAPFIARASLGLGLQQ
jgi:hypothetical protein